LILLGDVIGVPVGQLFIAATVPGTLLIAGYILYISWTAWRHPDMAPAYQATEGEDIKLIIQVLKGLLPPFLLIIAVLGSIFFGIASPTESAALGALGAIILSILYGRFSFASLREAAEKTTRLTSMVFIILIGATAFGLVFVGMGGDDLILDLIQHLPGGKWTFLILSMLLIFILGFFLDFIEICFIVVPIIAPVAIHLGFDPLWFALLIALNLQTSFLTPPFGFSLFYLKASAPPTLKLQSIYRGVVPFIFIQLFVLSLMISFPELSFWLPNLMDT
jgi:tripartite ATP-independent transporter DctM subunit